LTRFRTDLISFNNLIYLSTTHNKEDRDQHLAATLLLYSLIVEEKNRAIKSEVL
jgi:hypothetical protein